MPSAGTPNGPASQGRLLAADALRQGRMDDARTRHRGSCRADKKYLLTIGSLLERWPGGSENEDGLRPLAVALYESTVKGPAVDRTRYRGLDFQNSPARRLVALYQRDGRGEDARELLLGALRIRNDSSISYAPGYLAYKRINDLSFVAGELLKMGYPADAVRLYNDLLSSRSTTSRRARILPRQ